MNQGRIDFQLLLKENLDQTTFCTSVTKGPHSTYAHLIELNSCRCCRFSEGLISQLFSNGTKVSCGAQVCSLTNQKRILRIMWSDWLTFLQFKLPAKGKLKRVRPNGRNDQNREVPNEFRRSFPSPSNITYR